MSDRVLIPLPGIGTLELTREAYEAALRPLNQPDKPAVTSSTEQLVDVRALSAQLSLPVSCIYEYARAGRIPSVRAGKHVRFNATAVLAALAKTGRVTVGRA